MNNSGFSVSQLYSKDDSKFVYSTATNRIAIHAGQDGVTEAWIHTIKELHRRERNDIRRERMNVSLDAISELVKDKSDFFSIGNLSAENEYIQREEQRALHEKLQKALSKLTTKQRELLVAIRIQNRTISSIARDEGVHESSVRERLRRIEHKLRRSLETT